MDALLRKPDGTKFFKMTQPCFQSQRPDSVKLKTAKYTLEELTTETDLEIIVSRS